MRKHSFLKMATGLLIGGLALNACVDDKYDVSDLDDTIKIGNGLTLPHSSTGEIKLSSLFEVNDGAIKMEADPNGRKAANGDLLDSIYFINTGGSYNSTNLDVDVIKIASPIIPDIDVDPAHMASASVKGIRHNDPAIPTSFEFYDFMDIANAKTVIPEVKSGIISNDVTNISSIVFDASTTELTLTLKITDPGNAVQSIKFDQLKLIIPTNGLKLEGATYSTGEGTNKQEFNGKYDQETGAMTFFDENDDVDDQNGFGTGDVATIKLHISKADVGDGKDITFTNHVATLISRTIEVKGRMKVKILGIPSPTIHLNAKVGFNIDKSGSEDKKLHITNFSGDIQHSLNKVDPIELNDLPDFLTDPEVSLSLENPQIFMRLKLAGVHQLITTDIQLTSFDEAGKQLAQVNIDNLQLNGNYKGGQDIMLDHLMANKKNLTIPEEYQDISQLLAPREVPELAKLLNGTVPHKVKVAGKDGGNITVNVKCENVKLPISCPVDLEYKLYTPLSFGTGFKIIYEDEETDFNLGEDFKDIDFDSIQIDAEAHSTIPLSFNLEITPKGKDNSDISTTLDIQYYQGNKKDAEGDIEYKQVSKLRIRKNADGTKLEDNIRIVLKNKTGKGMNDIISDKAGQKQLNGISYKATLDDPATGQTLKDSQGITLKELTISLGGGLTLSNEKDKDK